MATTAIDIASKALVLIGADPITSFDDTSREGVISNILYEEFTRGEMSSYPWRFLTSQASLNRDTAAPTGTEWTASHPLPADLLKILEVKVNGYVIKFDRFGDKIHTNADVNTTPVLDYVRDVDEADWPHYFNEYIIFRLASLFASSLGRDGALTTAMGEQAELAARRARTSDSQGRTTKRLPRSRIVGIRFGGRSITGEEVTA